MAAALADVFDTTEVTRIEEPEDDDEDVDALMEALYGETQDTKNWCKDNAGGIEEDMQEVQPAEPEEQVVEDKYVEYEEAEEPIPSSSLWNEPIPSSSLWNEPIPSSFPNPTPATEGENFLEILQKSAAGELENFTSPEVAPTWKDELRRTAEAAAANIEAMTGTSLQELQKGSKSAEKSIASGSRFLAYGVMFASIITLLAKASMAQEETAAEAVSEALASTSARKLQLDNEELKGTLAGTADVNKLDATGEFTQIDEEDPSPDREAERKQMDEPNKEKLSEIDKVVKVAKTLALKESDSSDPEAAKAAKKILEAAQSLEQKERAKEAELKAKNHRGITQHSKGAFVNNQDQVDGYHNWEKSEEDKANQEDDTCVDDTKKITEAEDGVTGLYCKDMGKFCNHKVHGEGISKMCPKTCGLCGTATEDAEGNVQDEATRKAAEEERARLAHKDALAKLRAKKEAAQSKIDQFRGKTQETKSSSEDEVDWEAAAKRKGVHEYLQDTAPDTNAQCTAWAKKGECKNNKVWMLENCATSCSKHYIVDLNPKCSEWAEEGECENNKIYMGHHCPASCGGMNAPAPAPEPFSRAKRAAELKKQSKPKVKATLVRGKEGSAAKEELGGAPMADSESALMDMLANVPMA